MRIFNLILFLFLFLGAWSQETAYTDEKFNTKAFASGLNGNPHQVSTTYRFLASVVDDTTAQHDNYVMVDYYNPQGIRTRQQMFGMDGGIVGSTQFLFSSSGVVTQVDYNDQYGNLVTRVMYECNKYGNWTTATVFRGGYVQLQQIKYSYYPTGQIADIVKYGYWGVPQAYEKFAYDKQGRDSVKLFYDSNQRLVKGISFVYDTQGNMIQYTIRDGDGRLQKKYTATYSAAGVIGSVLIDKTFPLPAEKTAYVYDNLGNPIRELYSCPQKGITDRVTTINYLYDSHNNWIEKQLTRNNFIFASGQRIILYHK